MSSNVSMSLNTQDILRLNSNMKSLKSDIDSYLAAINTNLDVLSSAIGSSSLVFMISDISFSINNINGKLSASMGDLITFLDKQMKGYEETAVEATKMLRAALEFISENFPKVPSSYTSQADIV